jgi:hypothetical protein
MLVDMGILEEWQVDKIMEHQQRSRQRFGQIAVSWGWVYPHHVWQAWAQQLTASDRVVDLKDLGIDSAATEKVPPVIARQYQVVGVRTWGDNLVLAVPEPLAEHARQELPGLLGGHLYFCIARAEQVEATIEQIYAVAVG